jgi:hypothetical protein
MPPSRRHEAKHASRPSSRPREDVVGAQCKPCTGPLCHKLVQLWAQVLEGLCNRSWKASVAAAVLKYLRCLCSPRTSASPAWPGCLPIHLRRGQRRSNMYKDNVEIGIAGTCVGRPLHGMTLGSCGTILRGQFGMRPWACGRQRRITHKHGCPGHRESNHEHAPSRRSGRHDGTFGCRGTPQRSGPV